MSPKRNWLTRERVFAAVEAALTSEISQDALKASLVADRLETGSRATVYKYVAEWRQEQTTSSTMPPFALSRHMRTEALKALEQLLAAALRPAREEMHREVDTARDALRTAVLEREILLADLERTEDERDRVAAEGAERQDEIARLRGELAEAHVLNVALERDRHSLLQQLSGQRKQAELDLTGGSGASAKGQREHGVEVGAGSVPQDAAEAQQEGQPG